MYQKKIAYGSKGFPWSSNICQRQMNYAKGICPVAESLHDSTFIGFEMCIHKMSDTEIDATVHVFRKVWSNLNALQKFDPAVQL